MNRKELIAFVKSRGYTGALTIDAIKKWLAEQGSDESSFQIKKKDGSVLTVNVDNAWKKDAAFDDADSDSDDEGDGSVAALKAKVAKLEEKARLARANDGGLGGVDADDEGKKSKPVSAKQFALLAARKSYDRKADRGETVFPDGDVAEVCGAHMRLKIADVITKQDYGQRQDDLDILKKVHVEYDNTLGGAFVPIEFSNYLVSLKEAYDDPRQDFRAVPMARDKQTFDKDTGDLTVVAPGEGGSITASTGATANVELTANKIAILCTASNELMNDSAIPIAEWIGRKMIYSFKKTEQQCFWIGDGSATYFNFVGITNAMLGLSATRSYIAGLVVASGNAFSEVTLTDLEAVAGQLPDFDGFTDREPAWYMNKRFYYQVCVRLALAAGGVTAAEVEGKRTPMLLGFPVKFRRPFIRTDTNDTVEAVLGWPDLAATIGDVAGGIRIATSPDRYFDQDLFAFRATKRVAFKAHDVGNANATESSRVPGPVVGLLSAAS